MEKANFPGFRVCQMVLDGAGVILTASPDASQRLSAPVAEVKGRPLREILAAIEPSWEKLLPENTADWPAEIFLPWAAEGAACSAGLALNILASGAKFVVTTSPALPDAHAMEQSAIADFPRDPASAGQLTLRLLTAESRLQNYLHNFPGVFFSQRPDFSFSYVGPGFPQLTGADPRAMMRSGNRFLSLILAADRQGFLDELEHSGASGGSFSSTYRIRNPQTKGIVYLMDVRTPRHSPGGLLLGYEGVWLDVTRQSIAEARLSRSAWKENLATITSGLIHDFSNVMAGIFSLSELYSSSLEEAHPWKKGMTQIMESSRQARKLVRRIIDLNREQSGAKNYYNLETLITDQLDLMKAVMSRQTKIVTDLTGEELPVYLDDVSFRQTILNLALNSRDAIEKDGVIRIKVRKVGADELIFADSAGSAATTAPRAGVVIEFSDNGCGIPMDYLMHIWEPFFTTKEASKGSGFGLYNAKLFVEQSKGRIAVRSTPGKGTTFSIYLPLADFSESVELEGEEQQLLREEKPRRSVAILSAADASGSDLAQRMREKEWELIFLRKAEALRRYLREAPRCPDLFLTLLCSADNADPFLVKELKASHPGLTCALVSMGRTLDEVPGEELEGMSLALEDNGSPDEIVQRLEAAMDGPALRGQ